MTPIPTYQDQLNELQHQLDSLNGKFNSLHMEIAELRGFMAGLKASLPLPQYTPPIWAGGTASPKIKDMKVYYDGDTGNAPPRTGWSQIDTQAFEDKHAIVPTTDNDEGPEALAAQRQAQTDPDDYLAGSLT